MRIRTLAIFVMIGLLSGVVSAAALTISLVPGQSLVVSCANQLSGGPVGTADFGVDCAPDLPTATPAPSATPLPLLAAVDPAILGSCPAAVHDRYTVVGPDGKLYRTWHPAVVAVDLANPGGGSCAFAHEHGMDPQASLANNTLPAFGYIGGLVNDAEPHEGFKVFVANAGTVNNDNWTASNSTRIVFHMGTGGPKRFDTEFHSLQFDLVAADGHYAHVAGMADTGVLPGNICDNPRHARTVMELPSSGCLLSSGYEIWSMTLFVSNRLTVNAAVAVFDPITVLDQASPPGQHPLIFTSDAYPKLGAGNRGCKRESYSGPVYWYNQGGLTSFQTDAYGRAGVGLTQQVSANSDIGIRMASGNFYQFKLQAPACVPGLGLKN